MTALSIGPRSVLGLIFAVMTGCLVHGCGRTSLLPLDAQASPATGDTVSSVTSTGEATSQPATQGRCSSGFTPCGRGASTRCYDLTRSPDHCGQCGNACSSGIACYSSKCQQYQCKGGLTFKALPQISTMLSGDLPFETVQETYSSYRPALGDFDGDGILDFVGLPGIGSPMSLLLGKGDGTFEAHPITSAFASYWMAAAADLNGDGRLDLVAIAGDQAAVTVRLGNGNPATLVESAIAYPTPRASSNLVLADIDDDGHVDVVAADAEDSLPGEHQLTLWRGDASGTLTASGHIPVRDSGSFLVAADWNRDDVKDLVFGSSILRMMLGRGDGTFEDENSCGIALGIGLSPASQESLSTSCALL